MFFKTLGHAVSRFWPVWIALWVGLAAATALFVPKLSDVARDDRSKFLPSSADSMMAKRLLERLFPKESFQSRIILVIEREAELSEADLKWLDGKARSFIAEFGFENISKVTTPLDSKILRDKLVSRDGRAAMAVLFLSSHYVARESQEVVKTVMAEVRQAAPKGLSVAATADAVIGHDYQRAIAESIHTTTWATVLLLCAILIYIFRSPVTPVIPLATIALSFFISKGAVALFALNGVAVSPLTEILMIVILFGAGTDYCVFLLFRYCEEVSQGHSPHEAVRRSVATVGEAIASSATTVVIGIGCLLFAQFGPFKQTGPFIALGVAITLLAGLTLTPALMLAARRILFWPSGIVRYDLFPKMTQVLTSIVIHRPFPAVVGILLLLSPFFYFGTKTERSFDLFRELPEHFESRQGMNILKAHFSRGEMSPVTLVIESKSRLDTPAGIDRLYQLTRALSKRREVEEVRSAAWPTGDPKLLSRGLLKNQMEEVEAGLDKMIVGNANIEEGLAQIIEKLPDPKKKGGGNPVAAVFAGGTMAKAMQLRAALEKIAGGTSRITAGLEKVRLTMENWTQPGSGALPALDHLALPPDIFEKEPRLKEALAFYLSEDGKGAKLVLILNAVPYSMEEKDAILALRSFLKDQMPHHFPDAARYHFAGTGSTILDQRLVTQADFYRVLFFVLTGVFLVLLILLRHALEPIYLIATMVLNYFASLGLTSLVFEHWLGMEGMDWKVAFFMFVLLVALGEDYNIFLMSRIKEEKAKGHIHSAIRIAMLRTGPLIGICGIILAGTFLTLTLSSLEAFKQMGVGIGIGVLLATFLICPLLVPSLALIFDKVLPKR